MKRINIIKRLDHKEHKFVIAQLNRVGLAVTRLRLIVLSTFHARNTALTANDIYQILQKDNTPVSLSTIYNVVNHLSLSGILASNCCINGTRCYELNDDQHPAHLVCGKCGVRQKIANHELIESCKREVGIFGFESDAFSLAITGMCKLCSAVT